MSRRKSAVKLEQEKKVPKVEAAVAPPVEVVEELAERLAPKTVRCFRCSVTGQGMLCRRCSVALHGRPEEVNLYAKPVSPTIGY